MRTYPALAAVTAAHMAAMGASECAHAARLILAPEDGTMYCNIVVREPERQVFALTVPEDIGAADGVLIPHAARERVRWTVSEARDRAETSVTVEGIAAYDLLISAGPDYVDATLTVHNLGKEVVEEVWAFNCLAPANAPRFFDGDLERTYFSRSGAPARLADLPRLAPVGGTLGVYYHADVGDARRPSFVEQFESTNPDRTDDAWFVTVAEGGGYMAATSPAALFLFNNTRLGCLHSAAAFGDIEQEQAKSVTCRFYLAEKGGLDEFRARFRRDQAATPPAVATPPAAVTPPTHR